MATPLAMRAAIVAGIAAKLTTLRTCEAYHGEIDPDELRITEFRAPPAVMVVCMGFPSIAADSGQVRLVVKWGAFVVTGGARPDKRDDEAVALTTELAKLIPGARWSLSDVHRATDLAANNLYSAGADASGVAIWLVTWHQGLDLDPNVDIDSLADFVTFHAELDIDRDGVVDPNDTAAITEVTLEQA
jgi:phage gp37-like protein